MNCSTCRYCGTRGHDITSPGGFNAMAVEFTYCNVHEMPVELDEYCDDHQPEVSRGHA